MNKTILIAFVWAFAACTTLPKQPCPAGLVRAKDTRTVTGRWIWFNKANLTRKPGQLMSMSIGGGKSIDGLNALVFDKKPDIPVSLMFAATDWELQRELVHVILDEQLYKIVPTSCPTPGPVDPGPGPTPINDTIPYGVAMVHGVEAQAKVDLSKQILCVADTGVNQEHPDLKGVIIAGKSFVGGSFADGNGHGSHVSATALAVARNAGVVGVAAGARLLTAKVLSDQGSGGSAGIAQGVAWCADNGATVINLSLGSNMRDQIIDQSIAYAISNGVTVVVAAGNSGGPIQGSPAQTPGVLVATAIDRSGQPARFSSYGPEADFYMPGVDIVSASHVGSGLATMSGTSMASPHLAGIALIAKAAGKPIASVNRGLPSQYGRGMADGLETIR